MQDNGLYIVDISDIKNPRRLGKTGGSGAMVLSIEQLFSRQIYLGEF